MFRHLSIRYKLTLLLVGVVSVVLAAVTVIGWFTDVSAIRERLAGRYSTLASVVAAHSAAALSIANIDPSGVQEVLSIFSVEENIVFAALYGLEGKEVARYQSVKLREAALTPPRELGPIYTPDGFLDVVQEVTYDGRVIGRIYLRVGLDVLREELQRRIISRTVDFLAALLFAGLLSIVLQRIISNPILSLAQVAERVSTEHNYSLRAFKISDDELGTLCDRFNEMLAEIQHQNAELQTHRRSLEEAVEKRTNQLTARTEELSRSNAELEQFAYIASHDLQEPLRKVQAFGDMLTTQFQDVLGTEGTDYLQRMRSAAQRMQVLINDLLNFSRVMSKARPFEPVDLKSIAEQVLVDLESRIQQTGGRVEIGDLPPLDADPLQMRQLLQNLISNGLKYHRPDVAPLVTVRGRLVNADRDLPGAMQSELLCEIIVADNGTGFEQKYAERIFEPFERLHGREVEGTGMGLAICRKIVKRHGGTIQAQGIPNQGAVFVMQLPVKHVEGDLL